MINASEIQKTTGKKAPLNLLDGAQKLTEDSLEAVVNVSFGASFFQGHFPGNPVMPGVLIVEAMTQACQVLTGNSELQLSQLKKVRFREMVKPGDQLKIKVSRKGPHDFSAQAYVDTKTACSAEISFS